MTQNLFNYQAASQVARDPTLAIAKVAYQVEYQRCIATSTTGSVYPEGENVKPFISQESVEKLI